MTAWGYKTQQSNKVAKRLAAREGGTRRPEWGDGASKVDRWIEEDDKKEEDNNSKSGPTIL